MQKQVKGTPQDVCGYLLGLLIPEAFFSRVGHLGCVWRIRDQSAEGPWGITAKDQGLSLEKAGRVLPASRLRGLDMALPAWICVLSYPRVLPQLTAESYFHAVVLGGGVLG